MDLRNGKVVQPLRENKGQGFKDRIILEEEKNKMCEQEVNHQENK